MENTNQNPDGCWIKGRKNCRDKRIKTMELEYDSLLKALETRLSALEGSDKSFDWILRCLKKWKRDSCFCQSFEDELSALKECRQIFRDDVLLLKDDIESCHRRCEDQMAVDKQEVIRQKKRCNRIVEKAKAEAKERKKALLCKKTLGLEAELELREQALLNGDEKLVREEKMVDKKQEELEHKVTKDKEVVLPKQQSDEIVEQPNAETKEREKSQHRGKRLSLETELKLQALASETAYLDRKQSLLDGEEELLNREEALATGRRQLEELEKVLEETELLLQRRQKMCDRKQEDLINLHEELKELRLGLDSQQSEASDRAQRNWEMLRRELQDRHQLLESNIQKYRTELASASATITGKDIHITKLSQQIADLNRVIEEKDQKIGQLESRLAMALTETVKSDLTHFNQWRNNRGSFRSDSAIDQTSNFSSAEDSLPNSPLKFAPQNPFNHRHSFKANGVNFLNDASERKGYSFASRDEVKVTSPTIERHHHLNGKGEITPTKDKKNSSSACTIM